MRFYIILTYNSIQFFFYHLLHISYVDYPSEIPRVSKQPIAYVFSTWEQLIKIKKCLQPRRHFTTFKIQHLLMLVTILVVLIDPDCGRWLRRNRGSVRVEFGLGVL